MFGKAGSAGCGVPVVFGLLLIAAAEAGTGSPAGGMKWTHFTIGDPLPGSAWGTGGLPLADFDGDGDLDMVLSRRETQTAYWFERKDDQTWVRHTMGTAPGLKDALGAAAVDINGDGRLDVVSNLVWFENPGGLRENRDKPWPVHPFASGGHDIITADLNGDGRPDIVTYDGGVISWFDPAADLKRTDIGQGEKNHGGIAPKGTGDLDGDGDLDIVIPRYWFENPGKGVGTWTRHEWPHLGVPNGSYGTSMRAWIVDLNGDGRNDIVYSDCDTGQSHVYWVENLGQGDGWHDVALGDVDGDGDIDLVSKVWNKDGATYHADYWRNETQKSKK